MDFAIFPHYTVVNPSRPNCALIEFKHLFYMAKMYNVAFTVIDDIIFYDFRSAVVSIGVALTKDTTKIS